MSNSFYIFVAISLVSLLSITAILPLAYFSKHKKLIKLLVAFAAGALIGDVFLHMIPEMAENHLTPGHSFAIIGGIIGLFIFEQVFHWRHCHNELSEEHHQKHNSTAASSLAADFFHNFIDGVLIASSFYIDLELGIATTLAVSFHELPQEIGDFAILLNSKMEKKKAIFLNFLTSLSAFAGAILFIIFNDSLLEISEYIIAFGGGAFLYLAIADLLPEIKHESCNASILPKLFSFILGVALMHALTFLNFHHH